MALLDKEYIEQQYRLAYLDFKLSSTEDAQFDARRRMSKLELIASEQFGFDYSDGLKKLCV